MLHTYVTGLVTTYMKSEIKHIVVHGGLAHRGELLAIAIVLANSNTNPAVYRRNPTQEELEDPDVVVLDIGERYEPHLLNFDHHQMGRDTDPACALSLVATEMGIDEYLRAANKWYWATEVLDSKGPLVLSQMLKAEWPALVQMFSPVEGYILRQFGELDEMQKDHWIYKLLESLGNDMLSYALAFADRVNLLDTKAKIITVKDVDVVIVPEEVRGDDPILALEAWRNNKCPKVHITITPDNRGDGMSFCRVHDLKRIDLSLLKGHPEIIFAHDRGYIAKTSAVLDEPTIREMLEMCIREAQQPPAPKSHAQPKSKWPQGGRENQNRPFHRHQGNKGGQRRQHQGNRGHNHDNRPQHAYAEGDEVEPHNPHA